MKLLLLSDIHGLRSSMEWIHGEAWAGGYDLIAIAGDLIDAFAKETVSEQALRAGKWIEDLAASGTPLAFCSGNHDTDQAPTAKMVYGPDWLKRLHRKNLLTDSHHDWVKDALLVTCCPYNYYFQEVDSWTEDLLLAGEEMRAAKKAEAPWLVLHHDPPHIFSMISCEKLGASESLSQWLNIFRPDFVLNGHFHHAPYRSGFANKIQETWCLNPGLMEDAPEPNRIILDLDRREAEWIFFDSDMCKRREVQVLT